MRTDIETQNQQVFESILADGNAAAEVLYADNRNAFMRWARARFQVNPQDLEDIWQDAVITFVEQVRSRKVTRLDCSVRTWLFAIAYRKMLHFSRKQRRLVWGGPTEAELAALDVPAEPEFHPYVPLLVGLMDELSPQCRQLLVMRFYEEKKIGEIRTLLNLANENTTSASLSRCLSRLRKMMEAQLNRRS
ncbi:MAG: sigma-70 family RNA polymerase sigma factor [Saprospiraceae bacterium]|nr:sigma-70 family RNA polymerase sigma factor [Saprospiraceae bacterium]